MVRDGTRTSAGTGDGRGGFLRIRTYAGEGADLQLLAWDGGAGEDRTKPADRQSAAFSAFSSVCAAVFTLPGDRHRSVCGCGDGIERQPVRGPWWNRAGHRPGTGYFESPRSASFQLRTASGAGFARSGGIVSRTGPPARACHPKSPGAGPEAGAQATSLAAALEDGAANNCRNT